MSIQIAGVNGTTIAEVDPGFKAQRASLRPMDSLGWNSLGAFTGAVTVLGAGGAIFSFRNISANPIAVRRVGVGHVLTTGFTAAQQLQLQLFAVRAWSVSDSGGTGVSITGSNGKHRTSLAPPANVDCRVAITGAITPSASRTVDANALAVLGYYAAATTAGVVLPSANNNLFQQDAGDHPLILAQNEGFLISNGIVHGAGGVGTFNVNIEFAELAEY